MQRGAFSDSTSIEQNFVAWMQQYHNAKNIAQADTLPLRHDMVTLLTYVRDHKVVGTRSTGNMPRKAVREVTARFAEPPELDMVLGEHVYKLRSESEVWPLYFLHILAEVGDLLKIVPGRRWRLTDRGKEFLGLEPLSQASFLLMIWWNEVNWLVAFPYGGLGEYLPPLFEDVTLTMLLAVSAETPALFEAFADELIERTGLVWDAESHRYDTEMLRSSVERTVIRTLEDFGIVKSDHQDLRIRNRWVGRPTEFQITPLGRALLDAVAIVR